jgi:UDP-glucose 4-epimerase
MHKKKKLLILGADGFIGSNLAKSLHKEKKYKIFAFDLFKDGISRNLDCFDKDLVMIQGNFLNKDDLTKALEGIDYVFHFISLTTPGSSMNEPLMEIDTNIKGTISLLELCAKEKIKRIIFSSSGGSIYGDQNKIIYSEDDNTEPISPYAISKLTRKIP